MSLRHAIFGCKGPEVWKSEAVEARSYSILGSNKTSAKVILHICDECGTLFGYAKEWNGEKHSIDMDFINSKIKKEARENYENMRKMK